MARLIDWPRGVGLTAIQPLSGPRTVGGGSSEGLTGYVQTVASPFGLWRWQFTLQRLQGERLRRVRGLLTALHGGANAVRVTFADPDRTRAESGLTGLSSAVTWGNGQTWGNGRRWHSGAPPVAIAADAPLGGTRLALADAHWAGDIGVGDWLGAAPFHFGLYTVTEVLAARTFRVWPPLRRAVTTDDVATLRPVMAMRLESEDGAAWRRERRGAIDTTLVMIEVEDRHVRAYFGQ